MDFEFWKTASNVLLTVGIVLSAAGTFGAYYFSNKLDQERGVAETRRQAEEDAARRTLNEQITQLLRGNDELRNSLTPFERLAEARYPALGQGEALNKLRAEIASTRSDLSNLRSTTAPRHLSQEQRDAMNRLVGKLKGRPLAFACRMMDGESCDYATELAAFFLQAGCQVPEPIKSSLNDLAGYLAIVTRGKADPGVAHAVLNALEAARIPAKIEAIKESSVVGWYDDVVHVIVGSKAR